MKSKIPAFVRAPSKEIWEVDGALTTVMHWKNVAAGPPANVLFFIPGNPGVVEYYQDFLHYIYTLLEGKLEIIGVQHAGHQVIEPPQEVSRLPVDKDSQAKSTNPTVKIAYNKALDAQDIFRRKNQQHLWSLSEQIEHKTAIMEYLQTHRYRNSKFLIMGHSIGAYIGTQLLKTVPSTNIVKVVNLFPTLAHIRQTPNGDRLWPLFTPIGRSAVTSVSYLLKSVLRESWIKQLIMYYMAQSEEEADITLKLVHPHVASNTLYMAKFEMEEILELDSEIFDNHIDKMVFYYGQTDGWVPMGRYSEMKQRYPNANVHLCADGLAHAFVLGSDGALRMAEIVTDWIQ